MDEDWCYENNTFSFAVIAQLVEHTHGKGGVMGSNPIDGSMKDQKKALLSAFLSYCLFTLHSLGQTF